MAKEHNLGGPINLNGAKLLGSPIQAAPAVVIPDASGGRVALPQVATALINDREKAAIAMQCAAFMLQELERRGIIPPEGPPPDDDGSPEEIPAEPEPEAA